MPDRCVSRRDFARQVALGTATLPLGASALLSGCGGPPEAPDHAPGAASEESKSSPPESESKAAAFLKEAILLVELIKQRYPDSRMTDQVLTEIGREVGINLLRARAVANVALDNADEPVFVFMPFRAAALR